MQKAKVESIKSKDSILLVEDHWSSWDKTRVSYLFPRYIHLKKYIWSCFPDLDLFQNSLLYVFLDFFQVIFIFVKQNVIAVTKDTGVKNWRRSWRVKQISQALRLGKEKALNYRCLGYYNSHRFCLAPSAQPNLCVLFTPFQNWAIGDVEYDKNSTASDYNEMQKSHCIKKRYSCLDPKLARYVI